MRKIIIMSIMAALSIAAISMIAHAQEQKAGQPLYLPQDQVRDNPSDLHMGSDPGYRPGAQPPVGSDQTGYPSYIDPQQEQLEQKTVIKKADETDEGTAPPSRWGR